MHAHISTERIIYRTTVLVRVEREREDNIMAVKGVTPLPHGVGHVRPGRFWWGEGAGSTRCVSDVQPVQPTEHQLGHADGEHVLRYVGVPTCRWRGGSVTAGRRSVALPVNMASHHVAAASRCECMHSSLSPVGLPRYYKNNSWQRLLFFVEVALYWAVPTNGCQMSRPYK